MKKISVLLAFLCILPSSVFASPLTVNKQLIQVSDCTLSRTQHPGINIDRYLLKLTFGLQNMNVTTQDPLTIKNYTRALFIGSPIEEIKLENSTETNLYVFVDDGKNDAHTLCSHVRNELVSQLLKK